jgi:ribosomal protein S18 acetylase RimI-like enzyme
MKYKIRLARKGDIPEMLRIAKQNWLGEDAWIKRPDFEKILKNNPKTCWIMAVGGKIVGVRLTRDDFEHRIRGYLLMVRPEYRREGYGTILFNETNRILKGLGYRCLIGETGVDNSPSIKWHKKVGYKILCKASGWFFDDSDAILFYYRL